MLFKVVPLSFSAVNQEAEGPLSLGPSVRPWSSAVGVHGSWALFIGGGLAASSWPAGSGPGYNLTCRLTEGSSLRSTQKPRWLTGQRLRQWRQLLGPAEIDARDNLCRVVFICGANTGGNQKSCFWEAFATWRRFIPRNPWRTTGGWTES